MQFECDDGVEAPGRVGADAAERGAPEARVDVPADMAVRLPLQDERRRVLAEGRRDFQVPVGRDPLEDVPGRGSTGSPGR